MESAPQGNQRSGPGVGNPLLPPCLDGKGDHDHRIEEMEEIEGVIGELRVGELVAIGNSGLRSRRLAS